MNIKASASLAVLVVTTAATLLPGSPAEAGRRHGRGERQTTRPVAVIPFEIEGNRILVAARVGDQELQVFIDTGASSTVFDTATGERLGLEYLDGFAGKAMGAGGMVDIKIAGGPVTLALAGVELELDQVPVMDLDALSRRLGFHIDAVVGAQFFRQWVVQIDYEREEIRLFEQGGYKPGPGVVTLPVTMAGLPTVEVTIATRDGREVTAPLHVDTGAWSTLILAPGFVEQHGLLDAVERTIPVSGHGAANATHDLMGRLGRLTLGGIDIDAPLTVFSQATAGVFASGRTAGVLGGRALSQFTVTLDVRDRKLHLEKNGRFGRSSRYAHAGARFTSDGPALDRYAVIEVLEGSSAAEMDVQPGDLLVAINGRAAGELTLPEIRKLLRKTGKTVRLRLRRGDEEIRRVLKVRDVI